MSSIKRHLSLFALPLKNEALLSHYVRISQTNLPLNPHTRNSIKHALRQCKGKTFVSWPSFIVKFTKKQKLGKQLKKPSKYWSASLCDEHVTIVVTIYNLLKAAAILKGSSGWSNTPSWLQWTTNYRCSYSIREKRQLLPLMYQKVPDCSRGYWMYEIVPVACG